MGGTKEELAGSALSLHPPPFSIEPSWATPGYTDSSLCSYPGYHKLNILAFHGTEVNVSSLSSNGARSGHCLGKGNVRFSGTPQPQGLAHVQTHDEPSMNIRSGPLGWDAHDSTRLKFYFMMLWN